MELTRIPKPEHGSLEWLRARHKDERGLARISASVAACVHNEHEFQSAADLAVELLAPEPTETQTTAAMERGNRLEPVLIEWASSLMGNTLQTPSEMFCYSEAGVRLIATLDAVDEQGGVVEVKTTRRRWNGVLPRYWYWQGVQQAICTGTDVITWVIFDSDLELHTHEQRVTSDEKRIHIEACREFLGQIDMGFIPESAEMSYDNVVDLFRNRPDEDDKNFVELDADIVLLVMRLDDIKKKKQALSESEDAIKAEIGMMLGDREMGLYDGNTVVSWKHTSRKTFDLKRFEAEHPALADKFRKTTTTRTMRIHYKGEQQ